VELLVRRDLVAGQAVVALDGFVDLSSLPTLHGHLQTAIREHPGATVAVDLDAVRSLDDAGLGVLLGAAGRAREQGGDLVIICNDPRLRERFERTGLDRAIHVRDRLTGISEADDATAPAAGRG
jgi:anti-anti-sigma factor